MVIWLPEKFFHFIVMLILVSYTSNARSLKLKSRLYPAGRDLGSRTLSLNKTNIHSSGKDNFVASAHESPSHILDVRHTKIYCREVGEKTTIDGCRPTLDSFRRYPDFSRVQLFRLGPPIANPTEPSTPPYWIETPEGDCIIIVEVRAPPPFRANSFSGWFSWKDVRAVAGKIITTCEEGFGNGGMAGIGDPRHDGNDPGWFIMAVGKPSSPNSKAGENTWSLLDDYSTTAEQ